jgi:hypothetical protein
MVDLGEDAAASGALRSMDAAFGWARAMASRLDPFAGRVCVGIEHAWQRQQRLHLRQYLRLRRLLPWS